MTSRKVSVVLRANTGGTKDNVSLTKLRRYAGEIYRQVFLSCNSLCVRSIPAFNPNHTIITHSMAWDTAFGLDEKDDVLRGDVAPIALGGSLKDLIVYPQNLPNTPPEGWIVTRPDLSCIVSHDSITGWVTNDSAGSGMAHARKKGQGFGGLASHVDAVNAERAEKGLNSLVGIHVDDWPVGADIADDPNIVFLEDEDAYGVNEACDAESEDDKNGESSLMGGPKGIPPNSLFNSVCVGGTFDGLHYGHRKLLTLAISSVQPVSGKLLIGVTCDEMLVNKAFSDRIPPLNKRIDAVLDFVRNLAPGMQNRIRCISISDEFGPPGRISDFDALVCSHETLVSCLQNGMFLSSSFAPKIVL